MAKRPSRKTVIVLLTICVAWGVLAYFTDEDSGVSGSPSQRGRTTPYSDQASELLLPMPRARVNDSAYILTPEAELRVEEMLAAYEERTSTQIFVVTLAEQSGYDANAFTSILGNQWGVGQAGRDNGILIYLRPSRMPPWRDTGNAERPYGDYGEGYIATGYGVEQYVTDAQAMRIVRRIMAPHAVAHEYEEALLATIQALTDLLTPGSATNQLLEEEAPSAAQPSNTEGEIVLVLIFVLLIAVLAALVVTPFIILGYFFRRNKTEGFWRFYFRWMLLVLTSLISILARGSSSGSSSSRGGFSGGGGGAFGGGGGGGAF